MKRMNKWKIAFWCCLTILILSVPFYIYSILDQGVTLTHQKEACLSTEKDLEQLADILVNTNISKTQIQNEL